MTVASDARTHLDRIDRAASLIASGRFVVRSQIELEAALVEGLGLVAVSCMDGHEPPHWAIRLANQIKPAPEERRHA